MMFQPILRRFDGTHTALYHAIRSAGPGHVPFPGYRLRMAIDAPP